MPRLDGFAAPVQLRGVVEPAREQQRTIAREQMAEARELIHRPVG